MKAIFVAFALSATGHASAIAAPAAKPALRDGLFAKRPLDDRRSGAPPVARYVSDEGEAFILDRSQGRPLLKFDDNPEIWVLQAQPAPRGDIIYKNDLGEPMLRATRLGGLTVFTDVRPEGSAAALSGAGAALRLAPVGPVVLAERIYQASAKASHAARRTIPFLADNATPQSSALIGDAAVVAAEGLIRISRRKDGPKLLGKVGRVVFVEGPRPDAAFEDGVLRVSLAVSAGQAGRPSSERIVRAITGF